MTSRLTKRITGLIGLTLVAVFVLGLSHSISTGFAGFKGGLPFAIIAVFVLLLVVYDVWEGCFSRRNDDS